MAPPKKYDEDEPPKESFPVTKSPREMKRKAQRHNKGTTPGPIDGQSASVSPCAYFDFDCTDVFAQVGSGRDGLNLPQGADNQTTIRTLLSECPPSVAAVVVTTFLLFLFGAAISVAHMRTTSDETESKRKARLCVRVQPTNIVHNQNVNDNGYPEYNMGVATDEEQDAEGNGFPKKLAFAPGAIQYGLGSLPQMLAIASGRFSSMGKEESNILDINVPDDPVERQQFFANNLQKINTSIKARIDECLENTTPEEMQALFEWFEGQFLKVAQLRSAYPYPPIRHYPGCPAAVAEVMAVAEEATVRAAPPTYQQACSPQINVLPKFEPDQQQDDTLTKSYNGQPEVVQQDPPRQAHSEKNVLLN